MGFFFLFFWVIVRLEPLNQSIFVKYEQNGRSCCRQQETVVCVIMAYYFGQEIDEV